MTVVIETQQMKYLCNATEICNAVVDRLVISSYIFHVNIIARVYRWWIFRNEKRITYGCFFWNAGMRHVRYEIYDNAIRY